MLGVAGSLGLVRQPALHRLISSCPFHPEGLGDQWKPSVRLTSFEHLSLKTPTSSTHITAHSERGNSFMASWCQQGWHQLKPQPYGTPVESLKGTVRMHRVNQHPANPAWYSHSHHLTTRTLRHGLSTVLALQLVF